MNVAELWRRHTRGVDCCDFAQLVKVYRAPREGQQRYSTATLFRSPPVMACSVPLVVALQAECRLLPARPPPKCRLLPTLFRFAPGPRRSRARGRLCRMVKERIQQPPDLGIEQPPDLDYLLECPGTDHTRPKVRSDSDRCADRPRKRGSWNFCRHSCCAELIESGNWLARRRVSKRSAHAPK